MITITSYCVNWNSKNCIGDFHFAVEGITPTGSTYGLS